MRSQRRKLHRVPVTHRIIGGLITAFFLFGFLTALGIVVAAGVVLLTYDEYARQYVAPDQLSLNQPSAGAVILDRNGEVLYQFIDDRAGIRTPVTLDEVSPHLIAATIATEDSNFFTNPGVNFRGLARAAQESLDSFLGGGDPFSGTGGSSITQQLVKNVYIPQDARSEKSVDRKLRELVYAAEITKAESKEQILEWYLNEISYGGIYSGIEAASQGYFGKPASELTLGEAALLAGIPQSPGALDPNANLDAALQRREQVLDLMARQQTIAIGHGRQYAVEPARLTEAREEPVTLVTPSFPIQAPHFVLTYVVPQLERLYGTEALHRGGLTITTSLDLELQGRALTQLERWVREFERASGSHNGAAIVIEPATGEVLVMLGSRDHDRADIDGEVNNLLTLNSPGSSFKPFVYLASFEALGWNPETRILDAPVSFREADGSSFSPTNPGGGYSGQITIRNALGNSLNIPPFKAAVETGVPNVVAMAKRMGFTDLADYYGPAIALGGVDFKAIDLAYGYSVLANRGVMAGQGLFAPEAADERLVEPVAILKVVNADGAVLFDIEEHRKQHRVVSQEHADQITDILADPRARCITFGCGGLDIPGHRVAIKTGTSEPYDPKGPHAGKIGETWAFGYTPDLVVGVWAGNSDNTPIVNILSTSISFRAMRDILLEAYKDREVTQFQPTGGAPAQGAANP